MATKAKKEKLTTRVPASLLSRLRHLAVDEKTSVEALVTAALEEHLAVRIARGDRHVRS